MYDAIDKDKNGVLSSDEVKTSMTTILGYTHAQTSAMLSMLDLDGDSMVSFEEFVKAQTFFATGLHAHKPVEPPVVAKRSLTAEQIREARAVYRSFDTDGDGSLSPAELTSRMSDFGWSDSEILKTVTDMDTDSDGKVTREEFLAAYLDFMQFDDEILAD
eukprot:SAG22_NODE_1406_length_4490_cov_5.574357_3_plen_160_part_00